MGLRWDPVSTQRERWYSQDVEGAGLPASCNRVARNASRRCVVVGKGVVRLAGFVWESRTSLRRQMPRPGRQDGFSRVL